MSPADPGIKIGFDLPKPRPRRGPLALFRSRRHGKGRFLHYIILPVIGILTAVGVFVLLKS